MDSIFRKILFLFFTPFLSLFPFLFIIQGILLSNVYFIYSCSISYKVLFSFYFFPRTVCIFIFLTDFHYSSLSLFSLERSRSQTTFYEREHCTLFYYPFLLNRLFYHSRDFLPSIFLPSFSRKLTLLAPKLATFL